MVVFINIVQLVVISDNVNCSVINFNIYFIKIDFNIVNEICGIKNDIVIQYFIVSNNFINSFIYFVIDSNNFIYCIINFVIYFIKIIDYNRVKEIIINKIVIQYFIVSSNFIYSVINFVIYFIKIFIYIINDEICIIINDMGNVNGIIDIFFNIYVIVIVYFEIIDVVINLDFKFNSFFFFVFN